MCREEECAIPVTVNLWGAQQDAADRHTRPHHRWQCRPNHSRFRGSLDQVSLDILKKAPWGETAGSEEEASRASQTERLQDG